VIELYAVK
jgi:hypothetical protein